MKSHIRYCAQLPQQNFKTVTVTARNNLLLLLGFMYPHCEALVHSVHNQMLYDVVGKEIIHS